jgi:polyphosphate kinase
MRRNLDSRMETVMPVTDPRIRDELEHILDVYESDNVTAWDLQADNTYVRREPATGEEARPSQERFIAEAAKSAAVEL